MSPVLILVLGAALVLIGLLHCFFGYKLARFLMPLSGLLLAEGILYIYVYDGMQLNTESTWLFFLGSGVAVYLVLFFLKRIAAFFLGLAAGGLFCFFVVNVLGLSNMPMLWPACLTISAVAALLTMIYDRNMVVVSSSVAGACAAAFCGLYLLIAGVEALPAAASDNLLVPVVVFIRSHAHLAGGVALAMAAVGQFVQFLWTAGSQLVSSGPPAIKKIKKRNEFADSL